MTHIYLVRHAHSFYSSDELGRPLSERGFEDAKRITELLESENIDLVVSSPYKRAMQTVEGIANFVQQEIILLEDFKERLLSNHQVEDFHAAITKVWEDFNFTWEGGESSHTAQERGVTALLRILIEYRGEKIAIGTHGNLMALIMNHFDKKYDFEFWENLDMPDIYKLSFEDDRLIEVNRIWNRKN